MSNFEEQVAIVREVFNDFSIDKNTIERKQIPNLLYNLGISAIDDQLALQLYEKFPVNQTDTVTFDDFFRGLDHVIRAIQAENELEATFEQLDIQRKGSISVGDLRTVLRRMGQIGAEHPPQIVYPMITEVLPRGGNRINFAQFVRIITEVAFVPLIPKFSKSKQKTVSGQAPTSTSTGSPSSSSPKTSGDQ